MFDRTASDEKLGKGLGTRLAFFTFDIKGLVYYSCQKLKEKYTMGFQNRIEVHGRGGTLYTCTG